MAEFGPGKDAPPRVNPPGGGGSGGGGGTLSKKMMGLPMWAWAAIAAAGVTGFFLWRNSASKKNPDASTSSSTSSGASPASAEGLDVEQYESLLALLRDIQGEQSKSTDDDDDDDDGSYGDDVKNTQPSPGPNQVLKPIKAKPYTAPKTSAHRTVNVVKFTTKNPAWNSTLSGIAKHEHTTIAKLMKLNPSIKNPNVIHAGQRIVVS